jgi:hypothetical protein
MLEPKCYTLVCYQPSGYEPYADNAFITDSDFKLLSTYDIKEIEALWVDKLVENHGISNPEAVWQFTFLVNGAFPTSKLDLEYQVIEKANRINKVIDDREAQWKEQEEKRKLKERLDAELERYRELHAKFGNQ